MGTGIAGPIQQPAVVADQDVIAGHERASVGGQPSGSVTDQLGDTF
jgi:hypothetical protein